MSLVRDRGARDRTPVRPAIGSRRSADTSGPDRATDERADRARQWRQPGPVIVIVASVWTIGVGCMALVGWQFDLPVLTRLRPGLSPMFPLAACGFIGLGLALLLVGTGEGRTGTRVGQAVALAVVTLGGVTLAEYLFRWDPGIDTVLFPDAVREIATRHPGRPPPHAATAFVATGLALLALGVRTPWGKQVADRLCHLSAAIALAALLGYVYNAVSLRGAFGYAGMALLGAVSTVVVVTGALFVRPAQSFVAPFLSSGPGGYLARNLGPVLFALPFVVGTLTFLSGRNGYVDANLATTVAIVTSLMVLFSVIGRTARELDSADAERRAQVARTQQERDLMVALWEATRDGMALLDVEGRIIDVNDRWCELTGMDHEAAVGTRPPYPWLAAGQDFHQMVRAVRRRNRAPAGVAEEEISVLRPDGTQVPVMSVLVPVVGTDERPHRFMLSYRDMTFRRRAEERLRQRSEALQEALRGRDNFLASMSHELRTPLNSILGFTGTLLMRLPGPLNADQEEQLRIVERSAHHLLSLINDILAIGKIESGTGISTEPVEVQAVVREVAQSLGPLAADKGLALNLALQDAPIAVMADPRGLSQILINLVSNAIKFTETGAITIGLRSTDAPEGRNVELSVTDTGPGIPADALPRIFNRYERAATITRPDSEGVGLGLAIARGLAERADAELTVSSTLGEGTTFTLHMKGATQCQPTFS